jgi:hypothetical protein
VENSNVKTNYNAGTNKKSKKGTKMPVNEEVMHPLEVKYGKEPPIEIKPEDRWHWH